MIVDGCGGLWTVVEGWRVVDACGWLWRVVEGCACVCCRSGAEHGLVLTLISVRLVLQKGA